MKSGTKNLLLKFVVPVVIIIALFKVKLLFGILAIILYFSYMLFTNRASVFAFLGARSYSKGDSDDAIRWFERAYQSGVAKPRIITAYAYMLLKLGDIEASEKILNEQMSKLLSAEDKMNVKSNMALVLWKKGQIDDALIMLKEVFEDYKTTTVYGSLGYFLILKGDLDKALEFNLEAYEYNNSNAVILDNLGQTYYLMGEYDKSEEIYKKLISSNPSFPEPYFNYGLVMKEKGNVERALELMNQALTYRFSFLSTVSKEEIEAEIKKLSS